MRSLGDGGKKTHPIASVIPGINWNPSGILQEADPSTVDRRKTVENKQKQKIHTQDSFARDHETEQKKTNRKRWSPVTVQGHHIEACVWVGELSESERGRSP